MSARPNAQHKALRQSGLFRPKVERDRLREAAETEALRDEQEHNVTDYARDAYYEECSERQRWGAL